MMNIEKILCGPPKSARCFRHMSFWMYFFPIFWSTPLYFDFFCIILNIFLLNETFCLDFLIDFWRGAGYFEDRVSMRNFRFGFGKIWHCYCRTNFGDSGWVQRRIFWNFWATVWPIFDVIFWNSTKFKFLSSYYILLYLSNISWRD